MQPSGIEPASEELHLLQGTNIWNPLMTELMWQRVNFLLSFIKGYKDFGNHDHAQMLFIHVFIMLIFCILFPKEEWTHDLQLCLEESPVIPWAVVNRWPLIPSDPGSNSAGRRASSYSLRLLPLLSFKTRNWDCLGRANDNPCIAAGFLVSYTSF